MRTVLLFLALIVSIMSCSKTENMQSGVVLPMQGFDEWEIGDEFRYQLFMGGNFLDDDNPDYTVFADTLVLEVCGITDGRFVISEKLTPNSAIFDSDDNYYYQKDSVYTNYWTIRNDSIVMEQKDDNTFNSHLFVGGVRSLSLEEFTENETELFSWKIAEPQGNYHGDFFVRDGVINGVEYPHMNVHGNLNAMAADGPGFLYFYNREDGFIRTATISGWTGTSVGWERIPD